MRTVAIISFAATALALAGCCCMEDWDDDSETEPEFRSITITPGTTFIAVGWETYPASKAYLRLGSTTNLDGTYYTNAWIDDDYVYGDCVLVQNLTPHMRFYLQVVAVTKDGTVLESEVYSVITR